MMKSKFYIFIQKFLIGLLILLCGVQILSAQQTNPISLNDILIKLKFTSRISTSTGEINKQLIADIEERKVIFILSSNDEKNLRNAGASDLLIREIRNNNLKKLKKKILESQNNSNILTLQHILYALNELSEDENPSSENNEFLLNLLCKNKLGFDWTPEIEAKLKEANASERLINIIHYQTDKELEKVKESLYKLYTTNYKGDIERRKKAIKAAKEYIEKYDQSVCDKEIIDYLKGAIPILEEGIRKEENPDPYHPSPANPYLELYKAFDSSYKAKKWKELFEAGEEILKNEPEFLDVTLVLASVGFNKLYKEKSETKYIPKTIEYAERAIELIESNSLSKNFGALDSSHTTKEYPDGKSNALGWMNYIIGYLKYNHLNQKDESIQYFRKASEYNSEVKKFPEIQQIIKESLYQKFIDNYKGTCKQKKTAVDAVKKYLLISEYFYSDVTEYFRGAIPALEKEISESKDCQ